MKVAFWGIGKIGRRILETCMHYGIYPDLLVDTNSDLLHKKIGGIAIVSPEEAFEEETTVYVTCRKLTEIKETAQQFKNVIKIYDGSSFYKLLRNDPYWRECVKRQYDTNRREMGKTVFFLLDYGFAIGGIESWVAQEGALLEKKYHVKYIVPDKSKFEYNVNEDKIIRIGKNVNELRMWEIIDALMKSLDPVIVNNFMGIFFDAACVVKMISEHAQLVTVIHSDDKKYYDALDDAQEIVTKCVVISNRMQQRIRANGFDSHKLVKIDWKIHCEKKIQRNYASGNEEIRIGYAGRIERSQKRVDLLIDLAERLYNKQIPFRLELAGNGAYFDEMRKAIKEKPFKDSMILIGKVEKKDIDAFWRRQDIGISASEIEGKSISVMEAMSNGAVPVVTNTSGMEDDIKDGINGFIVPIGDISGMADVIESISLTREKLPVWGGRAHETILNKNTSSNAVWFDVVLDQC